MHAAEREHVVQNLDITALEAACRRETVRWRRDGASDTAFCLEIFRRALLHSGALFLDEAAREALVTIYTDHIRANINRKAFPDGPSDDLVQQTWLRFWQAAANGSLAFGSLEAALGYLRMATVSTVIEARRQAWRRQREVPLGDGADADAEGGEPPRLSEASLRAGPADGPFDAIQRSRFRERCREVIRDPLAYRIFWLRYSMGMAPREIAKQLAESGARIRDRAPTPRAVSDLLEQQIERLSADIEIRDLLQGD